MSRRRVRKGPARGAGAGLAALDGGHPFKRAVPEGAVEYRARRRRDGEVAYLHFDLAREMGLLPRDHPDRLTPALRRRLLDTFCLQIVNEYDFLHGRVPAPRDRLPGTYMATRYLQLQHPDRCGRSSGDGRSIWNGTLRHGGRSWDVSSCGTGVTRLCPATALEGRFFQTGNDRASYGCGTAALDEGLGAALMSEVFHASGIATERVLALIRLPDGLSINVRAAPNLLRPSHLFLHLRRRNLESLRAVAELFVGRQEANGALPRARGARRWHGMARSFARTFARNAALYEREYLFVWMDWDGDNVLADGGIVDYGSVRQFGLFHREYRFDDGPRMSTTIPEQRRKARLMVQKVAQIREALIHGRFRPLAGFRRDPILALFDREFARERRRRLLWKLGLADDETAALLRRPPACLLRFERCHDALEGARSGRGPVRVPDGLTWDALYCMRDLLRELPGRLAEAGGPVPEADFFALAHSSYASRADRHPSGHRRRQAREFQRSYLALGELLARRSGTSLEARLRRLAPEAARRNPVARITGNAVDLATERILRCRPRLDAHQLYTVLRAFVARHAVPEAPGRRRGGGEAPPLPPRLERLLAELEALVRDYREGL